MSKYWTEKVDGKDVINADPFNDAFDMIEEDINSKPSMEDVESEITAQTKKEYINLLNPEQISFDGDSRSFSFSTLEPMTRYCCNIDYQNIVEIFAVTDETTEEVSYYAIDNGISFSFRSFDTQPNIVIRFDVTVDTSRLMVVKGDELPVAFKPYGIEEYFDDNFLVSTYEEIDKIKGDIKTPELLSIRDKEYTVLKLGYDYTMDIDKDINFLLPNTAKNGDTILVMANILENGQVIDWGTTLFFNREIPNADAGKYDFIFEYDGAWYAGAIPKGVGDGV